MCQTAPLCLDQHPNYIRVDGKPAFAIYRIGLIAAEGALKPMLTLWRQLAVEAGLRGLHIVGTIGGHEPREQAATSLWGQGVDAGFHFVPSLSWAFDSSSLDEGKVEMIWTDESWEGWEELFTSSEWKALMGKAEEKLGKGTGTKGLGKGKKGTKMGLIQEIRMMMGQMGKVGKANQN